MITKTNFARAGTDSAHINTTGSTQVKPKLKFAIVDGVQKSKPQPVKGMMLKVML